jgi:protein O-GlcNAc transferase
MATISEAFATAIQHHKAGRLGKAEEIYRQILEADPTHSEILHLLGLMNAQRGNLEAAVTYIGRALALRPEWPEAQANLGNALREQGKPHEAVRFLERALQLRPDDAIAQNNLGNAFKDQGRFDEAVACYERALALKPDFAAARVNLGVTLKTQGNLDEAIDCFQRALALKSDNAAAHSHLGEALRIRGKLDDAIASYRRALDLVPELFAEVNNNLGITLHQLGKQDEAITAYRRALERRPNFAEALFNLANALSDQGHLDEAVASFRHALELWPDHAETHNNLGSALKGQGNLAAAIGCYRQALKIRPDYAEACNNLANAFRDQGELQEALAGYRRALDLKADYAMAHSNLLYTTHYCPGVSCADLALAHAEYDRRHAAAMRAGVERHERHRDVHSRLRLGFVSPDLGCHPVGYFLIRALENLSQERFDTLCYSDRVVSDGLTVRLQAVATGWRDVIGMSDQQLADQIRTDRVDILFDLAGHTARNRLLVFARRPAPIQITWIGYEGTTGLTTMDCLIADHFMIPIGREHHYREQILRMPDGYLCYDPPHDAPTVSEPPCSKSGFATFGCFHNLAKITPEVVALWAKILRGAPTTRLIMKYRGLGDEMVRKRFLDLFDSHGVKPNRLDLLPWTSYTDYLSTYHQADLVLDPFPFSGSTITCESLWMGVPVITCPGETFASRHSSSHLTNIGLTETIVRDHDAYVELAISLAGDPVRLQGLRTGLRERMASSPLCDGRRFANNLSARLQQVWEQWLGTCG